MMMIAFVVVIDSDEIFVVVVTAAVVETRTSARPSCCLRLHSIVSFACYRIQFMLLDYSWTFGISFNPYGNAP
jgi:hypothetical protein